jgi:two-component system, sensor histidine kinase and response regulator
MKPVKKNAPAPLPSHDDRPASVAFNEHETACILVVDDQPANIQIVGSVLGNFGHEIIPASDGATALKRLAVRLPDLILLDVLMPGMDGHEVCRQVKAHPVWKDIPVIFLSAADDKELIVRALNAGGIDYITKPFNHSELVSRVRTQLALKHARDRLKQLAEDKDELIGILTHDLKNYLGGVNMSAELLRNQITRLNDEKLMLLSENIFRSSGQLLTFLKEFLANTSADYGFVVKPGRVDLTEIANNVIAQYQETARRKNLEIKTDLPPAETIVLADATALDQVLDNLVSNALKFSPPGREVFISVRVAGDHTECVVRDQGPGFTDEDKTRMFRRYGRLSARPTGGEPSTGLGLSIVLKLVQAMNGELLCDSHRDQGTTFTIRLPHVPQKTTN